MVGPVDDRDSHRRPLERTGGEEPAEAAADDDHVVQPVAVAIACSVAGSGASAWRSPGPPPKKLPVYPPPKLKFEIFAPSVPSAIVKTGMPAFFAIAAPCNGCRVPRF